MEEQRRQYDRTAATELLRRDPQRGEELLARGLVPHQHPHSVLARRNPEASDEPERSLGEPGHVEVADLTLAEEQIGLVEPPLELGALGRGLDAK